LAALYFRDGRRTDGLSELENGLVVNSHEFESFFSLYPDGTGHLDFLELIAKYKRK
jgi:hypothetical protein